MKRKLIVKTILIALITLAAVFVIIGFPTSTSELVHNLKTNIRLGLDLRGGLQLLLQVQLQDAFNAEMSNQAARLKPELERAGIHSANITAEPAASLETAAGASIRVDGVPSSQASELRAILTRELPGYQIAATPSAGIELKMNPTQAAAFREDTLARTRGIVEKKINGLGLTESTVQPASRTEARAEILAQIPGADDPGRLKAILETAAVLEWKDVIDGPFESREQAFQTHQGVLPLGSELVRALPRAGRPPLWHLLSRTSVIHGTDIRDAHAEQSPNGGWVTAFTLSQDAAGRFERYTTAHIGKTAAIVLDGQAISVAVIENTIRDSGQITGAPSRQDAADLALNLRAGALPARLEILDNRGVGASLGADSIRHGIRAGLVGLVAVVAVMFAYYGRDAWNATAALLLNGILLIGALCAFQAVLTLPGIAGLILTIGMAVDSNVLIFERMREEARTGKVRAAVIDAGFQRAFRAIVDTHVTTITACICLFIFGTPAIQGFAITLAIGLVANVFTSVFVSRAIFEWELLAGWKRARRSEIQTPLCTADSR